MSYCRFSNESDVYAYRDGEGMFVVHVATVLLPLLSSEQADRMSIEEIAEFTRNNASLIGGRFDGSLFVEKTPAKMFSRLRDMATLGYRVPGVAWETIHKEHPDLGLEPLVASRAVEHAPH